MIKLVEADEKCHLVICAAKVRCHPFSIFFEVFLKSDYKVGKLMQILAIIRLMDADEKCNILIYAAKVRCLPHSIFFGVFSKIQL